MIMDFRRALVLIPSPLQASMPMFLNHEGNTLFQYLINRSNLSVQIIINGSAERSQKTISLRFQAARIFKDQWFKSYALGMTSLDLLTVSTFTLRLRFSS